MAGKAKPFSKQTQRYLRTLPAVDAVTATRIYYTDEFRREVMRRYDAGIVLAPSSVRMGSIPKSLDTNVSNAPLPDGRMVRPHFISPMTTMPISTIRVTRSSFRRPFALSSLSSTYGSSSSVYVSLNGISVRVIRNNRLMGVNNHVLMRKSIYEMFFPSILLMETYCRIGMLDIIWPYAVSLTDGAYSGRRCSRPCRAGQGAPGTGGRSPAGGRRRNMRHAVPIRSCTVRGANGDEDFP